MKSTSIIAYFIDLFATFFGQVGYLLMKKALLAHEANGSDKKWWAPYISWKYLLGFFLLGFSAVVHGAVLPYADLVLLSTLTAVGIVFSTLLAVRFLQEKFICKYDLPSFTLIIMGCTAIVCLSNQEEKEYTPETIKALIKSTQYIVFIIFYFTLAISSFLTFKWVMNNVNKFNLKANAWMNTLLKQEP